MGFLWFLRDMSMSGDRPEAVIVYMGISKKTSPEFFKVYQSKRDHMLSVNMTYVPYEPSHYAGVFFAKKM
ncbi:uncharacterized protein PHALS_06905 [Plasmopara halstedii]|uniref:Uncharacterized protein n=1 Tax=Plasmopara halstedii TaxID=4781 RepID=A0A0P1B576_PLAHL|nr:uncharacterized protein PHALS_06905 [Plasmopara halstedii]CEG49124.1 hypothetical protein PHALS_06905 [Plasmopara halstedii]|eukprot:XP_024585493.1 hypothetical protein PHALS_06905 [Plasmopara halstedii]